MAASGRSSRWVLPSESLLISDMAARRTECAACAGTAAAAGGGGSNGAPAVWRVPARLSGFDRVIKGVCSCRELLGACKRCRHAATGLALR